MIILGVDPGVTGGLAWVENANGFMRVLRSMPMPVIRREVKGKRKVSDKSHIHGQRFMEAMEGENTPSYAIIEQVNSMPGMGAPSVFQFGRMFGAAEALLHAGFGASGLLYERPHVWKGDLGVRQDKMSAILTATAMFGSDAAKKHWPEGPRGGATKFEGVAEAALIALYAHRNLAKLLKKLEA